MEDKIKYEMEFPIQVSPSLLYQYISTPSGLSEWYADNVNSRGEFYTFFWSESEEEAKLLIKKSPERVKFRWLEDEGRKILENIVSLNRFEKGDFFYAKLRKYF